MAAPFIPIVYALAGVYVRAKTKEMAKRLTAAGFRKTSEGVVKSKANIIDATKDNIIRLITRGIAKAKTSNPNKPVTLSGRNKPRTKIIRRGDDKPPEAQTSIPKTNRTVNVKFDKSQKLSRFQNAGKPSTTTSPGTTTPFTRIKTGKRTSPVAPTAVSAAGERPTIDSKPLPKGPKVSSSSPKQPGYSRTGPKADKLPRTKPTGESKVAKSGVLMLMSSGPSGLGSGKDAMLEVAREAGFKNVDTAPPINTLQRVIKPKTKPATVKKQLSAFGSAFKKARANKEYSFTFKDKKYTTRYKEETVAEHKKKFQKKK